MSRNSSGTYTLPTGNPVVAGTTIESSWANTTLSDIATEITNSLARTGAGGMTAALRLANGTSTVPGLAWGDETGTGFYRAGTSDTRFVTQTALIQQWTASGTAVTGTFSVTGNTTLGDASGDTLTITGTAVTTPNGLNIDSDTLVVDAANDRVGVGTSSPTNKLHVVQASGTAVYGTTAGGTGYGGAFWNTDSGTNKFVQCAGSGSNGILSAGVGLTTHLLLDTSGNLGVGTSSPAGKVDAVSNAYAAFTARASTSGAGQTVDALKAVDSGATNFANAAYSALAHIWKDQNLAEKMRLDASGNLGLGVTPSAWLSTFKSIDLVSGGAGLSGSLAITNLSNNAYLDSGAQWRYKASSYAATFYGQTSTGQHEWFTAPSGTAGNAITFTQAMTLTAAGDLGIGISSPGARLAVDSGSTTLVANFNSTAANGGYVRFQNSGTNIGDIGAGASIVSGGSASDFGINVRPSGSLIFGTGNNERARITSGGDFIHQVNGTAPTLGTNSTMSFELTSNTSLKIVVRGTDGVTRSATLTLS